MDMENRFETLQGRTITQIEGLYEGSEQAVFYCEDGSAWRMYHKQDCCEYVCVEEIHGDVDDLIDQEVVFAYESSNNNDKPDRYADSFTWTFYRITTRKGTVVIRWLGQSNGYYSESVTFEKMV